MSEGQLQANVMDAVKTLGLLGYHTFDSRRSTPGFPDLVIVGARGVIYRELKTATGRVTPAQRHWITALRAAGQDADVWRPQDWPDRITRELRALCPLTVRPPTPSQAELRRRLAIRSKA